MMKVANCWFDQATRILSSEFPEMLIKRYYLTNYENFEAAADAVLGPDPDLIIIGFNIGSLDHAGDIFLQILENRKFTGKVLRLSILKRGMGAKDSFGNMLIDDIEDDDDSAKNRIIPAVKTLLNL